MIINDLHVHSIQSLCGMHTVLEIVEIAADKGMKLVNISDHGSASGKNMNFGVLNNKLRFPRQVKSSKGVVITVLAGIETNILDIEGSSDFVVSDSKRFDLVSAGIHTSAKKLYKDKSRKNNTTALENYLKKYPLDIFTHPCINFSPMDLERIVELSLKYGFALEVNNTNLKGSKTNTDDLRTLIKLAADRGARMVENSDGHSFYEIGENDKVQELLEEMQVDGDALFLNRDESALTDFLEERKKIREKTD
jgi:putative hydrolase